MGNGEWGEGDEGVAKKEINMDILHLSGKIETNFNNCHKSPESGG